VNESIIPRLLSLGVTDLDPDYVRLDVTAADGVFAGFTEVYESLDSLVELAAQLEGFPSSPADRRDIMLGSRDPKAAGGWVSLLCRCVDRSGHPMIEIELSDKYSAFGLSPRTAHMHLRVEAPAVDEFVETLRNWSAALGSKVTLRGVA